MDKKIVDFTAIKLERESTTTFEQTVQEKLGEAFQIIAEQHGRSDAWAADKTAIAVEIMGALARPPDYAINIKIPAPVDEAQQAAINAAVDAWAKEYALRVIRQCLEAFGARLMDLTR